MSQFNHFYIFITDLTENLHCGHIQVKMYSKLDELATKIKPLDSTTSIKYKFSISI